jgi:hypothetical protein
MNAHLQGYEPGDNVQTSRGTRFRDVISKLFPQRGGLAELKFHYGNTGRGTDMAGKIYGDPERASGFSTLKQLHAAVR